MVGRSKSEKKQRKSHFHFSIRCECVRDSDVYEINFLVSYFLFSGFSCVLKASEQATIRIFMLNNAR